MEISAVFTKKYAQYYDLIYSKKSYEDEIRFIYDWADKPNSIFDIGCGTANYWKYYPKKTRIFGVDKSESMIDQSKDHREILKADITKIKMESQFDCATALFDVINYIPKHDWWKKIPVKQNGYFIFDIWNTNKVYKDGFHETLTVGDGFYRRIKPISDNKKFVELEIEMWTGASLLAKEVHKMYLYTNKDILNFCGDIFEITDVKSTKSWQTWYKLKRK